MLMKFFKTFYYPCIIEGCPMENTFPKNKKVGFILAKCLTCQPETDYQTQTFK